MLILAYIDPGSGSLIFQMLIMGLMSLMYIFRSFISSSFQFIKRICGLQKPSSDNED